MSSGRSNYRARVIYTHITTTLCSRSYITMTLTYLVNISNRRFVVETGIDSTIRHIAEVKRRPSLHITPTHTHDTNTVSTVHRLNHQPALTV